jgi:hypothetical protein
MIAVDEAMGVEDPERPERPEPQPFDAEAE